MPIIVANVTWSLTRPGTSESLTHNDRHPSHKRQLLGAAIVKDNACDNGVSAIRSHRFECEVLQSEDGRRMAKELRDCAGRGYATVSPKKKLSKRRLRNALPPGLRHVNAQRTPCLNRTADGDQKAGESFYVG